VKAQATGMQELTGAGKTALASPVHCVAYDRMSNVGEMHTDLMSPPSQWMCLSQRIQFSRPVRGEQELTHYIPRAGPAPTWYNCHPLPMSRVAPKARDNKSLRRRESPIQQRQVDLFHGTLLELALQRCLCRCMTGDNYQPGGIPVQAVYDTRSLSRFCPWVGHRRDFGITSH